MKDASPWPHLLLITGLNPDIQTLCSSRNSKAELLPFSKARGADPERMEEDEADFF